MRKGQEYNPPLHLDEDQFSDTWHMRHQKPYTLKDGEQRYTTITRAKLELDVKPLQNLLIKMSREYSIRGLAVRCQMQDRTIQRVLYAEHGRVHIDTADKICIAFNTTLLEVYGE